MKTLTKETWQIVRHNLGNVLLFELLYRGITMPVYLRFINRVLRFALEMAGYSYLTAANIGSFLVRPWTMLAVFAAGIIGILFLLLEIAGLITAFQGSAYYQKLTPFHILWGALHKVANEAGRHDWKLGLVVLVDYFLMNLFLIGRGLSHIKPVNFVIQEMMSEPSVLFFFSVLLAGSVVIAVPSLFACFGCMVEQKTFTESMKRSRKLLKGHRFRVLLLLIFCNLLAACVTVFGYLLSVCAAAVFVAAFTEKNMAMAVLLLTADRLELLFLFLGGIITVVSYFAALSAMYYQYGSSRLREELWDYRHPLKGTRDRRRIAAVMTIIFAGGLLYIFDLVQNGFSLTNEVLSETQITAHRGSSGSAPENTMAAVKKAIEEMADYAEIDVQMTSDGVLVLGHDASLKRVTGINRSIGSYTWEELKKLDVGSWFSAEYAGERIPTLEEVIEYCRGRINLNIEIKNVGKNSTISQKTVELIQKYGFEEQCVVTSASFGYLKQVKELAPQIRTGYIISAAYGNFYSSETVDFISIRSSFVDERLVENVHSQGKAVHVWTVNQKGEIERLRLLGVDNIITDYPILAREIIYREEATETLLEYLHMVFR